MTALTIANAAADLRHLVIPSAHLAADPVLPAPGSAGESPGPYAAHAGAAAGRGPTAPGAAVAAEAGQPSATVHASAVPGHSTPGVGANAVPAPSPGSTQTSAETFRKRYSAALAAKGRHARNQRGRRPAKPVTGYVVPPPERGGAA
jgi:hypothetical protein